MLDRTTTRSAGLVLGILLWLAAFAASVTLGTTDITLSDVWQALSAYDGGRIDHIIIVSERLPRAVIATLTGSSLAIAGVLMQTMTRNPLASPGILGINAGAFHGFGYGGGAQLDGRGATQGAQQAAHGGTGATDDIDGIGRHNRPSLIFDI